MSKDVKILDLFFRGAKFEIVNNKVWLACQ